LNIISIDNVNSQRFSINLDSYNAYVIISKPPEDRDNGYGIMDLFVEGYPDIFGIPMIKNQDILEEHIRSGCLPVDIGAFFIIPSDDEKYDVEEIAGGFAMLMYLTGPEVVATGMFI
jgi:hypothetical protein